MRDISDKVQEGRLRWYGHVMRRDEEYVGIRVMELDVRGRRRRGRPRRRWMDCIGEDLRGKGLTGEEVHDRPMWRRLVRNNQPHIKVGKDEEEDEDWFLTQHLLAFSLTSCTTY